MLSSFDNAELTLIGVSSVALCVWLFSFPFTVKWRNLLPLSARLFYLQIAMFSARCALSCTLTMTITRSACTCCFVAHPCVCFVACSCTVLAATLAFALMGYEFQCQYTVQLAPLPSFLARSQAFRVVHHHLWSGTSNLIPKCSRAIHALRLRVLQDQR